MNKKKKAWEKVTSRNVDKPGVVQERERHLCGTIVQFPIFYI